jgi:SAM-dependent methyltransferase/FKBP-type peptidyl-prolyl cis-trans isomerase 2
MTTRAHAPLGPQGLASVTVRAVWSDGRAQHEDHLHVAKFSVWRESDWLPPPIAARLAGMHAGEEVEIAVAAGELTGTWDPALVVSTRPERFDRQHRRGLLVTPRLGRFYPQGFLHGVAGITAEAVRPLRITELAADRLVADLNHPLARFSLTVGLRVEEVLPGRDVRGGSCSSPFERLLEYPGFSAPLADGRPVDYGEQRESQSRLDERPDAEFYAKPRMVQHLDAKAREIIESLYRRLLPEGAEVLDLMASFDSHLDGVSLARLHVLGMNAEELAANRRAEGRIVQDLNRDPVLPFPDAVLHGVVCTASIEYLTRPQAVLAEVLRVLRPRGVFVTTFSNRWFPTKAIRLWSELHEFERVGLVTHWLQQAGFSGLATLSVRGHPRPSDDKYANEVLLADPVYAVWGYKGAF